MFESWLTLVDRTEQIIQALLQVRLSVDFQEILTSFFLPVSKYAAVGIPGLPDNKTDQFLHWQDFFILFHHFYLKKEHILKNIFFSFCVST